MDLDSFIITVFCLVDDALQSCLEGGKVRRRGPQPVLSDSEVLTMEVVGQYLGLSQDKAIFDYFRPTLLPLLPRPVSCAPHHLHKTSSQPLARQGVGVALLCGTG